MRAKHYLNLSRVKRKKEYRKKILKWSVLFIALTVISVSAFTGYAYWKFTKNISEPNVNDLENNLNNTENGTTNNTNQQQEPIIIDDPKLEDQSFAVLLIGLDQRPGAISNNTDAIIVSIVNPSTEKVSLLSIPRDTKVYIPNYGYDKINGVYAKGEHERILQEQNGQISTVSGATLLMDILSDLLDIPIEYYVKVDFQGFKTIIDQLGGLEVYVDRDMYYYSAADGTYINLNKGLQNLNGENALDFARFRKSLDGNDSNDFERNQRQQELIKVFVDELVSINGISKIFGILDIAGEHIKINIDSDEINALFWKYKGIKSSDIQTIKMESYWENPYVMIEQNELERIQLEVKKALEIVETE